MSGPVVSLAELTKLSQRWRAEGRRIVATNGCFDLLHVGHVRYLTAAASLGDLLVVGVNGDDSVRELKGEGRPLNRAADRAEVLSALAAVDCVSIFPEKRALSFLEALRPEVYAKGGDYTPEKLDSEERAILEKVGSEIHIIPFAPGYSTTAFLTKISEE